MSLWSTTEKPKYLSDAEKALVAGVDTAEAAANNLNAGWVRIQEYTDAQGNSRRKSETLVAMGTIPTDGNTAITDDLAGGVAGTTFVDDVDYASLNWIGSSTGYLGFTSMTPEAQAFISALPVGTTFTITSNLSPTDTRTGTVTSVLSGNNLNATLSSSMMMGTGIVSITFDA